MPFGHKRIKNLCGFKRLATRKVRIHNDFQGLMIFAAQKQIIVYFLPEVEAFDFTVPRSSVNRMLISKVVALPELVR